MTESMNIEDFEGWDVYSPEDIQFSSIKECEEVLNSEEFEEYVTTLASRNSYATLRFQNEKRKIFHGFAKMY